MWPWQLKAKRKTIFWGKIFIFSSTVHFFALTFLFFLYKGENFVFNVSVNTSILSEVDIVYLPLQKTVSPNLNKKAMPTKKITTKKVLPKKKKPVVKKPEPKKVTTLKKASPKPKKPAPVKVLKKEKKVKKEPIKKSGKIIKKESKPVRSSSRLMRELRRKMNPENQPVYLGRHDIEALRLQDTIQSEVEKHWRPPVGFSEDLCCIIKVFVGWNGSIERVRVEKSSGVLIYDLSARAAASKLKMPAIVKGKEINITFNQ